MDKIHKYYFLLAILLVLIIGCFVNVKVASNESFSQNFVLDKKLVIIAGSSQGLGKEISKFFNSNEYFVITHGNKTPVNKIDNLTNHHISNNFTKEIEIIQFVENIKKNYNNDSNNRQ